ncbi:unnamed protein product [Discula destructiva]
MGCCFSRPSGPNAPYPGASSRHSTSSRAINQPPSSPLPLAQPARRRRQRRPLDQHINKPLRRHHWDAAASSSSSSPWTRSALDAERAAFFDTRVTGRPEVWQGLRAALEMLWERDGGDSALATAQSILDAVEVTLPTGDLADGAYDALGNYYQLAECVVSDPVGIEDVDDDGGAREGEELKGQVLTGDEEENEEEQEARMRRDEKGKSVVDRRVLLTVVVRMSDTGRDARIEVGKQEGVRSVIRRLKEETGHPRTCRIRLVHFGKILRENASLAAQGWEKGHVLSAFVYDPPDERD